MAENVYEGLFILDPNHYAKDPGKISGSIDKAIEKLDGEILASRLWAEMKLAYPIEGHHKGTYWLGYFRMDATKLDKLNRANKLNKEILRSLVLKGDPRLVDAMVAHAKGETLPGEGEETEVAETETAEAPEVENGVPELDAVE